MTDKREFTRHNVELSAEVYANDQLIPANTRNLSESGVCLSTNKELTEGAVVGISLFLATDGIEDPDAEPINLKADVVWCSESDDGNFMAGAQFKDLSPEDAGSLQGFISQLDEQ